MKGVNQFFSTGNDHIVIMGAQNIRVKPDIFPNRTLHVVALERGAPSFQGNSQPEMAQIIFNPKQGAFRKSENFAPIEKPAVLPRMVESCFGNSEISCGEGTA